MESWQVQWELKKLQKQVDEYEFFRMRSELLQDEFLCKVDPKCTIPEHLQSLTVYSLDELKFLAEKPEDLICAAHRIRNAFGGKIDIQDSELIEYEKSLPW